MSRFAKWSLQAKPSDHTILHDFCPQGPWEGGPQTSPNTPPQFERNSLTRNSWWRVRGYLEKGYVSEILDTNLSFLLGQWLNLKVFGITYFIRENKPFKRLYFRVPFAKWALVIQNSLPEDLTSLTPQFTSPPQLWLEDFGWLLVLVILVISRLITLLVGITTPVTHLFSAI